MGINRFKIIDIIPPHLVTLCNFKIVRLEAKHKHEPIDCYTDIKHIKLYGMFVLRHQWRYPHEHTCCQTIILSLYGGD